MTAIAAILADPALVAEIVAALEHRATQLKEVAARAAAELAAGDSPDPVLETLAAAGRLGEAGRALRALAAGPAPRDGNTMQLAWGDATQILAGPRITALGDNTRPLPAMPTLDGAGLPVAFTPDGRAVYGVPPANLDAILAAADQADDPAEAARARTLADLDRERDAVNGRMPTLADLPQPAARLPVDRQTLAARTAPPDLADGLYDLAERLRTTTWPPTAPPGAPNMTRHAANVDDLPARDNTDADPGDLAALEAFLSTEQPNNPA